LTAAELLQMAAQLAVVLQQTLLALEHWLQPLREFALKDVWQCLQQGFQIGNALLRVAQLLFGALQSPLQVLFQGCGAAGLVGFRRGCAAHAWYLRTKNRANLNQGLPGVQVF
jgi:hypothetical protein